MIAFTEHTHLLARDNNYNQASNNIYLQHSYFSDSWLFSSNDDLRIENDARHTARN